jgi:hypothetical protein
VSDVVTDDELLYRCIFRGSGHYYHIRESGIELTSQAFTDRNKAPSVDRAKLCGYNPKCTQKNPENGVASLLTSEVRMIDNITQSLVYKIDVCPRPTDENLAHAQIEPSPEYKSNNHFRKLTHRLALLATERIKNHGWEIEPYELRT